MYITQTLFSSFCNNPHTLFCSEDNQTDTYMMSSVNHDDFAHLKIPLEIIQTVTNNFDYKNLVGEDAYEKFYKGKLLWSGELINILAGRLNKEWFDGDQQFWMEVAILSSLKHKNLVSLVGFCYDKDEKVIIYKDDTRGSLNYYLSDPRLTWVRRLEISVGIAQALSYIHYDESRDFSVIHRNIDSVSIYLNDDWEPKLGDFIRSMKIKASERHNSFNTDKVWSTDGYTDPTYIETKRANHKSDMYSFGIVMFELLCGREAVIAGNNNKYLAPLAITHYREKTLYDIIDPVLWKQMDRQSFNVFTKTAYDCLNKDRSQRPNIDEIVTRLEKALRFQLERENAITSNDFGHLYVPLEDILSATNNFADENLTREDGFANEYRGQLSWSGELISIAARRLKKELEGREQQFWMEISALSSLKHKSLVSLVGFCDENGEKIIVNKHQTRGSLSNYLSDPLLTWVRRLEISVGLAHALSYIHYDESREFSLIHRDIKSYSVLLNDNWEPKLCDFELSMKTKSSQRHLSFNDSLCGTKGYTDPAYINTHTVSHKSDLYSFGIVLFELLCSRKSVSDYVDNKYLAPVATFHYKEKILHDIIDFSLWKQINPQSLNVFADTAYACLNEEPSQRPNIDEIVTRLENALKLQLKCQKTEHSIAAAEVEVEGTSSSHDKGSVNFVSTPVISGKETMSSLKDFSRFKLSMEDMKSTTNGLAPENIIRKSSRRIIYEDRLLHPEQFDIIGKYLLSDSVKDESKKFWKEILMLSSLKHKNLVSLIGYVDEEDTKIIIYKREANGSLSKHLSNQTLTWMQRLNICVGVAKALSYILYDTKRDFSVLHCNIKSSKILLDDKWEPKLSGFERSLKKTVAWRHRLLFTRDIVENVYLDPKYKKTGGLTHKSDVYSFGVVLFEVLCGRSAVLRDEDELGEGFLSQLKKSQLDDMIDQHLKNQMDAESLKIFSETAYCCIKEERADRPYIDQVVKGLEKALELQSKYINLWKNLEHLKIALNDIELATENFADKYYIGEGGYGMVYKAQLKHFDSSNSSSIDGENKCGFPKKQSTVAIKRITSPKGEQGFNVEIETLTSCRHENIISLLGFCYEGPDHMILVYELASKGSLEDYLGNLTWMQRLKICLDVAYGLNYIHTKQKIIHQDIKSGNILLGDNWEAKIADFGLSKLHPTNQEASTLKTNTIAGTKVYWDPEYQKSGRLNKKSDIYSFGVVLFEILTGRVAYDRIFTNIYEMGIAPVARHHLEKGTLMKIVDHKIKEEIREHVFSKSEGPNDKSLAIFTKIAFQCIAMTQVKRPSIDVVINELKKALYCCQGKNFEHLKIALNDIELATENFADKYCIGESGYGMVYKAQLEHFDSSNSSSIDGENKCGFPNKQCNVAIKCITSPKGEQGFNVEIEKLTSCKHENIISFLGFCDEDPDHMILVYELASKGSLEDYLGSSGKMTNLTWMQRLKICLDVAYGLNYIHTNTDQEKQKIIHRDIKSANILLGDNWVAKIADFGLSKIHPADQDASTFIESMVAGTNMYLDPEYQKFGRLNKKSDIYSFGVVLFEILTGKVAYDRIFTNIDERGIAPIARHHFEKGTLMEMVDCKIKEETNEHVFSLSKGPDKESLVIFSEIAFRCLAETQAQRPTIDVVINELKKAIYCQENHKDRLKLSLQDIKLATKNFNQDNLIGHGDFGNVYKGHTHGHNFIAAKRLGRKSAEGEAEFMTELEILMQYKHENVIGLVGYCDEENEKIIAYEYASRGSLDKYLSDDSLTWVMRLKICIDIAIGLEFLHGTVSSPEMVIHRDINSSNILLLDDWKAKISDFGLSLVCPTNQDVDYVIDNVTGTIGYRDPLYSKTGFLTKESDVFSLGAVLFDILCGKLSSEKLDDEHLYLPFLAKHHYYVEKLDKLVFEGIKEQIVRESYITFTRIALKCLHHRRERRPTAHEVVIQLKKALEFQEDYEKWEPKLPKDYKEIIQKSECPEIYSTIKKEDLYNIFSKRILLQQDKMLMSFDGIGGRNAMVSATLFSYKNSCPHEWKSLPESRFGTVVEMLDISELNIEIKTRAQFLSPNVVYGVYLVFKFCDSRNCSNKPMYVHLKYRKGQESLHAYFATWRDEQWMMIEFHRFLNQKEHVVFEFLLESFSTYYCGDGAIFLEGIEFRAIDRVKYEENRKLKEVPQVLKSNFNVDQVQQLPTKFEEIFKIHNNYDELFWLGEVNGKKLLVLSPKAALYKFSNVDLFTSIPSPESRFPDVIEVLPQQVFYLKCTIRSQMLSPDTEYVCYLVFKLSEKCQGLHCPVKVRDVLHKENNEAEFVYFTTPSSLNINGNTRVPKHREDGWMEIQVWKFNSTHEFKDGSLSIDMKFTSHEGTMSGLIVCGLEFRPV